MPVLGGSPGAWGGLWSVREVRSTKHGLYVLELAVCRMSAMGSLRCHIRAYVPLTSPPSACPPTTHHLAPDAASCGVTW